EVRPAQPAVRRPDHDLVRFRLEQRSALDGDGARRLYHERMPRHGGRLCSVSSPGNAPNRHSRTDEVAAKLTLLREQLDRAGRSAVALTTQASVAWLTAGLTNPIDRSDVGSLLWLVVTPDRVDGITTTVERPRLEAEAALGDLGVPLTEVPWNEPD